MSDSKLIEFIGHLLCCMPLFKFIKVDETI